MIETREVNTITTKQQALKIVVSLGKPSKMPCPSYSIPADRCQTGQIMCKVEGSTCSDCYALATPSRGKAGWYQVRPIVKDILEQRYQSLSNPQWTEAMIFLIKGNYDYFRWHDAGDLQGLTHLDKICKIAFGCPDTLFWLPTREWEMVTKYFEKMKMPKPKNLVIRLSSMMVDGKPPTDLAKRLGVQTSTVVNNADDATCPAFKQGHKCQDCRKCWNDNVENIAYLKH